MDEDGGCRGCCIAKESPVKVAGKEELLKNQVVEGEMGGRRHRVQKVKGHGAECNWNPLK